LAELNDLRVACLGSGGLRCFQSNEQASCPGRLCPTGKSASANRATRVQNTAKCVARKSEFRETIQRDLGRPDRSRKIICFSFLKIGVLFAPSRLMKRGVRVVTIRGVRDAVGATASRARAIAGQPCAVSDQSAQDERRSSRTAKPCGPGTRCWCQAGGGCSNPTGFR